MITIRGKKTKERGLLGIVVDRAGSRLIGVGKDALDGFVFGNLAGAIKIHFFGVAVLYKVIAGYFASVRIYIKAISLPGSQRGVYVCDLARIFACFDIVRMAGADFAGRLASRNAAS